MKKLIIIGLVIVVAGVGLYFGLGGKDKLSQLNPGSDNKEPSPDEQSAPVGSDSIFAEPIVYTALKQEYSGQNFSFKYSEGFKVSSAPVGAGPGESKTEGEIVTIENSKGSGFQIFIIPWDEPGPITPERIWQDMPEADVLEPKNADLDGAKTLVFYGYDEDFGETFEAWLVYKAKLYQIAGPKTAEQLITETLNTWDWN